MKTKLSYYYPIISLLIMVGVIAVGIGMIRGDWLYLLIFLLPLLVVLGIFLAVDRKKTDDQRSGESYV